MRHLFKIAALLALGTPDFASAASAGLLHSCTGFPEGVSVSPSVPNRFEPFTITYRPESNGPVPAGFVASEVESQLVSGAVELTLVGSTSTTPVDNATKCASYTYSNGFPNEATFRIRIQNGDEPPQVVSSRIVSFEAVEYVDPQALDLGIRPAAPDDGHVTSIVVPVPACFQSGIPDMDAPSLSIESGAIAVTVAHDPPTCFAAGDPEVVVGVPVAVGILEAGTYSVTYRLRYRTGVLVEELSRSLMVTSLPANGNASVQMAVEYRHTGFGHYFFTSIPGEIEALDQGAFGGVWKRTGLLVPVLPIGTGADTCRFFNASFGSKSSHFYTPFQAECSGLPATFPDWQFEGVVFGLWPPRSNGTCALGTAPLYRMYNMGQGLAPNHRYVMSAAVGQSLRAAGWVPEGITDRGLQACVPLPG